MQQQMQTREEQVEWTSFRTRFLEKYFPDTAKRDREEGFLALQQGEMTVQEYVNKFKHRARYYSQNITEEWRCLKFERGLKHELKKVVTPLRERRFSVLVEQAKSVDHLEKGPGPVMSRHQKNVTEASCPEKKSLSVKKPAASPAERARAAGRVFALTSTKATKLGNLILEPCLMLGQSVLVLFDSGATHSFIANACVGRLKLVKRDLGCELLISTPFSGQVATSSVCVGCSMEVAGHRFKVNLVCLSLEGLDVILGMDWLSNNHIIIDCGRRILVFPEHEGLELISAQRVINEVEAGAICFMIVTHAEKNSTAEKISVIPVVEEYADVFPDEIPEFPPSRDVDFTIDLILGVGPVSMAPYRMAPTELAELKKQIKYLLEKKFIRTERITLGSTGTTSKEK
ncbi:uncharacterized protein LOC114191172 [Vigna unguiculata]|uniref:uncharacterized protein LOC114191172 n=1 Tax=Vigna unguiculata TaxID=3917 RepID=UPI001016A4AF|nr:uncharacterized protein LOC114191172 [Vigna unguiculata]